MKPTAPEQFRLTRDSRGAAFVPAALLSDESFGMNGFFFVPRGKVILRVMVSDGSGIPDGEEKWEHVSVSLQDRCPTWDEMAFAKDMFFTEDEAVMQLHPPKSDYVNNHKYCLHLWRPKSATIPLPPSVLVGIKGLQLK